MIDAVGSVLQAQQASTIQQIQMAVARKILDAQAAQGEAIHQLLEAAVARSKAPDRGHNFDAVA